LDLLVPPGDDADPSDGSGGSSSNNNTDIGEAFRREMAQVQFRNFVHEQQFYSWQFRSKHLYGGSSGQSGEDGGAVANEGGNSSSSC